MGLKLHEPPKKISVPQPHNYSPLRIFLLICITFVFALEICYKLATRQAVFVFQPCHMLCIIHIVLLGERKNSLAKTSPQNWESVADRTSGTQIATVFRVLRGVLKL